jgi:hypothetical protein
MRRLEVVDLLFRGGFYKCPKEKRGSLVPDISPLIINGLCVPQKTFYTTVLSTIRTKIPCPFRFEEFSVQEAGDGTITLLGHKVIVMATFTYR